MAEHDDSPDSDAQDAHGDQPRPGEGDGGEAPPPTGWRAWLYVLRPSIALGIVVVSVLGSLMSYRASLAEQKSARSEKLAAQQEVTREALLSTNNQLVDQDLRIFGRLQQNLLLARELQREAAQLPSGSAQARELAIQAQQELALARAQQSFLQGGGLDATGDLPRYSSRLARQQAIAADQDLQRLTPHALALEAKTVHTRVVKLVGLAALFIAALFFLTLAEATTGGMRRTFVVLGLTVALGAAIGGGLV